MPLAAVPATNGSTPKRRHPKPTRTYPRGRRCAYCPTLLSIYNPTDACSVHGPAYRRASDVDVTLVDLMEQVAA